MLYQPLLLQKLLAAYNAHRERVEVEKVEGRRRAGRGILKGKYKPDRQLCARCLFSQSRRVAVKKDRKRERRLRLEGSTGGLLRYHWMDGPQGRRGTGRRERGGRRGGGGRAEREGRERKENKKRRLREAKRKRQAGRSNWACERLLLCEGG